MKVSDYILVTIAGNGFGFSGISNSDQLDHYISSTDYDRSSYEFKHARLVLIYESSLDQETKEKINKAFQKHLAGE
ncbi:hypothetical protein SOI69_03340 [Acinetobacter pittii]|uniref:hypothetical protein n=1 Tax=Acinetobacter pittii TaxID=48296 RepID=UPI002A6A95B9|nr:hypothetical protein [Acinetobacter pittii]WPP56317.1 hypothetical protein SOI69_03340 [Acinetobacter pittii]